MLQTTLQPICKISNYNVANGMTFGEWLRDRRKQAGLTQQDVAARAQMSFSYVSTLERQQPHSVTGNEIMPTREKVAALAKAVGGNVDEALRLCGYASNVDVHDLEDVRISFLDGSALTDEDKEEILKTIRRTVAGIKAEKTDE